jgi:hypothetical protein
MAYDAERLDRIERILEETAAIGRETAVQIGATVKAQDSLAAAMQVMIDAQTILLRTQDQLTATIDRLAQLWGRSPN